MTETTTPIRTAEEAIEAAARFVEDDGMTKTHAGVPVMRAEHQHIATAIRALRERIPQGGEREEIARIINPGAFKYWQSLYDHCLAQGDGVTNAKHYADQTHGSSIDDALAKADTILARHRQSEGVEQAFLRLCEALEIPATAGAYLEVPRILASLPAKPAAPDGETR